jgi:RNA polymerase sigma-70 factor (ECF subfamily)
MSKRDAVMPDEQIARWEGIGLVRLSLEILDERSRELIRLKFNEDLSYKEIGALLEIPIGTVMSRLARARKQLGEILRARGSGKT